MIEILIVVYLVSIVTMNVMGLIDATHHRYSNGEFLLGFLLSFLPIVNTIFSVAAIWEVLPNVKWFKEPFFIQPKDHD